MVHARYLAERAGAFDVTIALQRRAEGEAAVERSVRITGVVQAGTPERTAELERLIQTPLLDSGKLDDESVVEASIVQSSIHNGSGILVDIRSDRDFLAEHAQEAVHVPFDQLHGGGFMANRTVYLTCGNLLTRDVFRARDKLMRQGVKHVEIAGGADAWETAGGKVFRAAGERRQVEMLEPAALFQALGSKRTQVVGLGVERPLEFFHYFPNAAECLPADRQQAAARIDALLRQSPETNLILVAESSEAGQALLPDLDRQAGWAGRVWCATGGLAAYGQFAERFSLAAEPSATQKTTLRRAPQNGPLTALRTRPGGAAGCSTCQK